MANRWAVASGTWTSAAMWNGGTVPTSADVVYANNFTVTIASTVTVQALRNDALPTSAAAGGTFRLINNANVTCTNANGIVQGTVATSCISASGLTAGQTATLSASITSTLATAAANTPTINHSSAGTLRLIGNYAPTDYHNNGVVISNSGGGLLEITGNVTGPSGTTGQPIATVSHTGVAGTTKITGTVTGGATQSTRRGATCSAGTLLVVGTVVGGSTQATNTGVENTSGAGAGIIHIDGTCQGGPNAPAVGYGASVNQITRATGPFLVSTNGQVMAMAASAWKFHFTQAPTYMQVPTVNPTTNAVVWKNLYTADNMPSGGYPVAGNVRSGTVYGSTSEFTGTLAVPAAGSVALGVAVDNTVGTAVLTQADARTALGMASANLDQQLAQKATVDQVASIVQTATSN